MADDIVSLTLAANAGKLNDALAGTRASLQALSSPVTSLAGQFSALGKSIGESLVVAPIKAAKDALDALIPSANSVRAGVNALESSIGSLSKTISSGGATSGGTNSMSALLLGGGALGIAAAGALKLFQIVGETNERLKTMVELADRAGTGLAHIQELKFAANRAGVKDETFVAGVDKMADTLNDLNSAALKDTEIGKLIAAQNLQWKDQEGHLVNLNKYLEGNQLNLRQYLEIVSQIAERGDNFQDKAYILGIAGATKEWVNILGQGPEKLRETMAEAQKVGAVLNGGTLREMVERQKDWNEQVFILATKIESVLLPALAAVNRIMGSIRKDWADTVDMWSVGIDKAGKIAGALAATFSKDYKEGDFMRSLADQGLGTRSDFGQVGKPEGGSALEFTLVNIKQLTEAKEKLAAVNQKLGGQIPFGAGRFDEQTGALPAAPKKGPDVQWPEDAEQRAERIHTAMEKQNQAVRSAQLTFQASNEFISRNASLFILSEDQKTAALIKALKARTEADIAAEDAKLKIPGIKPQVIQGIEDQKTQIIAKAALEQRKIEDAHTQQVAKEWESALGQVQGAWDSQLSALIGKTETFHQAMKNMARTIVLDWIKEFEKAAVAKLAVAITLGGAGGLQGGVGGAAFSGLAAMLGGGAAALGLGGAGVGSDIAAGGGSYGALLALLGLPVGFAVGAWEIPDTMLGTVHKGEMIVPAGPAEAIRSGAGIGGPAIHFSPQVSAIDARGVQAFMEDYVPQIAKSVSSHMRKNPTTFR